MARCDASGTCWELKDKSASAASADGNVATRPSKGYGFLAAAAAKAGERTEEQVSRNPGKADEGQEAFQ